MLAKFVAVVIIACVLPGALSGCDTPGTLSAPARYGPPGMVTHGAEQQLWLLVKKAES